MILLYDPPNTHVPMMSAHVGAVGPATGGVLGRSALIVKSWSSERSETFHDRFRSTTQDETDGRIEEF